MGDNTRAWVENWLPEGQYVDTVERLRGGWTSDMLRLRVAGGDDLVLRSFVKPFYVKHAEGLLNREAEVLRLLGETGVPAATLYAVDATAVHCDHPSLLMSLLPGSVRLDEDVVEPLARQLVRIHQTQPKKRPRVYQAWTAGNMSVRWQRAVDIVRREPPRYEGCFLHRDFHPGNVLFTDDLRITGVVDWVETSWGPADLDVAHCSTTLTLLHGLNAGKAFTDHYVAAGGKLAEDPADRQYWRMLDALAFAPDAEKVAGPWRDLGRDDLTQELLTSRLEDLVCDIWG